jgi:glycosyltransferase involved in cell wall biosynthesis
MSLDAVNGIPVWRAGIKNLYFHFDELRERRFGGLGHALWHAMDCYNPFMARYVRQVVREFRPDIASCHNLPGWSIAAWDALSSCGVPIVQVLHDQYLLCASSMMYRADQRCLRQCTSCHALRLPHRQKSTQVDTLVGVSRFICEKLIAHGHFDGIRRVRVIPNIRDMSHEIFPQAARPADRAMVFGYIGRISQSKGIEFLLDSFCSAHDRSWKLLVAGSGEADYEAALKIKFQHPQVGFLGQVPPNQFFPLVDCTVVPSLWEDTFPSVIFESLLYGRPVLGSNIGGIPEMIGPKNGRLFSPGDTNDLILGLKHMASMKSFFRGSFSAIQQDASIYRDKQRWIEEWSDTYSEAIEAYDRSSIQEAQ